MDFGVDDTELPYFAGLFDSQGTVVIAAPTPQAPRRYRLMVAATMTAEEPIRLLNEYFGGHVQEVRAEGWWPKDRVRYDWRAGDATAAAFLGSVRPWLIVKRRAADIGMEFQKTIGTRGVRTPQSTLALRADLRSRLQRVNHGG